MTSLLNSWYRRKPTRIAVLIILCFSAFLGVQRTTFGSGRTESPLFFVILIRHYGMNAREMEESITIPMENALSLLPGIVEMRSSSEMNSSRISLRIDKNINMPAFFLPLREAVHTLFDTFPDSVQRPEIYSSSGRSRPVMVISLSSPAQLVVTQIMPALAKIPDIGEIIVGGESTLDLIIQGQGSRLRQAGLSIPQLAEIIRSSRGSISPGSLKMEGIEKPVTLQGGTGNPESLKELYIPLQGGNIMPLENIASISLKSRKPETISRLNGEVGTLLYIRDSGTRSPAEISREVRNVLSETRQIDFSILYDFGHIIEKSLLGVTVALGIGMVLSTLFFFLLVPGVRLPILLSLIIPFNVFITLGLVPVYGLPLDVAFLSGVALAIGVTSDAGIILVHACIHDRDRSGSSQIIRPLTAGSLTTILAVIPLLFSPSATGVIVQMSKAFCLLTAVSTTTAVLFLPPLFIGMKQQAKKSCSRFRLVWFLLTRVRRRIIFKLTIAVILAASGITALVFLPRSYLVPETEPVVYGQLECQPGSSFNFVDREMEIIARHILSAPGAVRIETLAKRNRGTFSLSFNPRITTRSHLIDAIKTIDFLHPESYLHIRSENSRFSEVKLDIIGPGQRVLKTYARKAASLLQSLPWVENTVLHFTNGYPLWVFEPDRRSMAAAGIPFRQAASSLRWGLFGPVIYKWVQEGKELDARVMGQEDFYKTIEDLRQSWVMNRHKNFVPITSLGSFRAETEEGTITRLNRQRSASISIQTAVSSIEDLRNHLREAAANLALPDGYGIRIDPELKRREEAYRALRISLLAAMLLVYMVLAGQYESFSAPLLIFLSIPLSLSFPLIFLASTGNTITVSTFLGLVVTTGLSVNTTILIVDDVLEIRRKIGGLSPDKAVKSAIRKRIAPLLLTTGSTLLGLVPLFFFNGHNASLIRDLTTTVFIGVVGSAVVSLFFLPGILVQWPFLAKGTISK